MLIITSYWSGELPDITKLHFESLRALNPTTEYVLYLDSDEGFEGVVPHSLIHWHNQWKQIPEKGSPFDVLLSKFQS